MRFILTSFALSLSLCLGCGGGGNLDTEPVAGKVSVKGGGVIANGIVQFSSGEHTSIGGIAEDGTYTMSSEGEGDGVPPGDYTVVFLSTQSGGDILDDGSVTEEKRVIAEKYEDPTATDIKVTVPGGNYDFELDPPTE